MNNIHPTNIIADSAKIGNNVTIGAYNVIEQDVVIGDNVTIGNFNTIGQYTEIDDECNIFHNSSIGVVPQDKKFGGEKTKLIVGKRTVIREFVTLNRGTSATGATVIGDDVFVGSNSTLVAPLKIEKGAFVGAGSVVTRTVKENELAVSRARQKNIQGWQRPTKKTGE